MDLAELTALLTPEGLRLLDGLTAIESTDDVARTVSRLRAAGHAPELVSAVVGQASLRARARGKFGEFAERMLFTRAGARSQRGLSDDSRDEFGGVARGAQARHRARDVVGGLDRREPARGIHPP